MKRPDPHLLRWAQEQRRTRHDVNVHDAYVRIDPETSLPMEGWGGINVCSSNNEQGRRELNLDARPVLPGFVELMVELTTQPVEAAKGHRKRATLYATPTAMRELADRLLHAAAAADRYRPELKPVE